MLHRMLIVVVIGLFVVSLGCATKKQVRKEVDRIDTEMETIESSVEQNQVRLKEHDSQISDLSRETKEAMERAQAAEKLAQGKLLYEITLTDEDVRFGFNQSELTDNARNVLESLITQLKADNRNVFIEVQGHTDSLGTEDYNMKLGQERSDAVRRYLSENGIPLHRISTISYGETRPLTDNKTKKGRSTNRRVVIIVLE
ncbi:OmpA family protein [bacterium]|nr:OmpA family protein [bacterium]MCI0606335.1 OmpA family protein [bacterium]